MSRLEIAIKFYFSKKSYINVAKHDYFTNLGGRDMEAVLSARFCYGYHTA